MIFEGFTSFDFEVFRKYKIGNAAYDKERRLLGEELHDLEKGLTRKLREEGIKLEPHITPHWLHPTYRPSMRGMWLSYTQRSRKYFELPQLQVYVSKPGVFVGVKIPQVARHEQMRFLGLFLIDTFTQRLRMLPTIKSAAFAPYGGEGLMYESPRSLQQSHINKFLRETEPGEDWLSIGYHFRNDDVRVRHRRFIDTCADLLSKLYWVYAETSRGELQISPGRGSKRRLARPSSRIVKSPSDFDIETKKRGPLTRIYSRDELAERTREHQRLVKLLFAKYDAAGFECRERPFDLFVKIGHTGILHEVKTVKSDASDERSRVREAVGQLAYYQHFDIPRVLAPGSKLVKVALFQIAPSTEHIAFLRQNGISTIWLGRGDEIQGDKTSMTLLNQLVQRQTRRKD